MRATYPHESAMTACTLTKEGFVAMAIMRPRGTDLKYVVLTKDNATLNVWAPDDLAVDITAEYDWLAIKMSTRHCGYCKKVGRTVRIGFAGRCCPECREKYKAVVEYRGWAD